MLRRVLVMAGALAAGAAVSGGLLAYTNPDAGSADFIVVARDIPAGGAVGGDGLVVQRLRLGAASGLAFRPGSRSSLGVARATHDLAAGQLLQRGDVAGKAATQDRRLVWLPVKEMPPALPGDRLDLLVLTGSGDRAGVAPLAFGLEVRSVAAGGVVVAVPARQATALVFASTGLRLAAVISDRGSTGGDEPPINSFEQAQAALRG